MIFFGLRKNAVKVTNLAEIFKVQQFLDKMSEARLEEQNWQSFFRLSSFLFFVLILSLCLICFGNASYFKMNNLLPVRL